jgi:hypothetical protein
LIPSSVVVFGKESFQACESLESVTFESDSRLERIEESAFRQSGLKSIEIPTSVTFIGDCAFLATPVDEIEIPAKVARELGEEEAVLELDGGFDDLFG